MRLQSIGRIATGSRFLNVGLWGCAVGFWIATAVRIIDVRRRRKSDTSFKPKERLAPSLPASDT